MKSDIRIDDRAGVCRIEIEGTIGVSEAAQFPEADRRVATYEKFRRTVAAIARIESPEVVVDIRSTGGDVNDALLIHDALVETGARVTTRCYGYTASAATIIAQAASEGRRLLSANALYLIHRSQCAAEGNAPQLDAQADLLRQTDRRLASLYAARSGRDPAAFEVLMAANDGDGRWLSPAEAVEAGLADGILPDAAARNRFARGWQRLLLAVGLGAPDRADPSEKAAPPETSMLPETFVPPDAPLPAELPASDPVSAPAPSSAPASASLPRPDTPSEAPRAAAETPEAFLRAAPTRTLPVEDPSPGERLPSERERAYAADARRFGEY